MPYAGYNWTNATNLGRALADAPNVHTGGWFWTGTLYFLWFVSFALMSFFGWEVALLVSCFAMTVIGIPLVYLDAIAWQWLIPFVAGDLFMFLYIMWGNN